MTTRMQKAGVVFHKMLDEAEQRGLDWAAHYLEDIANANLDKTSVARTPHYMQLAHEIRLLKKENRTRD